ADARVEGNTAYNNSTGLQIYGYDFEVWNNVARDNVNGIYIYDQGGTAVGQSHDNLAWGNSSYGMQVWGGMESTHDEAHDNGTGFYLADGNVTVSSAVSWRNGIGVYLYSGTLRQSRIFGNATYGLWATYANSVSQNVIFDNGIGIYADGSSSFT